MTIREIAIGLGFTVDAASQMKAEKAVTGLKNFATKALSAIGIGFSAIKLNELIEEWNNVNKQLKIATSELEDQQKVQEEVLESANECRIAYKDMATSVATLMRSGNSFFKTSTEAAHFLRIANQAFKVSGATTSQISTLNNAITNAFTTGRVSAGNFNTIMSASPNIVKYLAEHLKMTERQVKALGLAGNITAKQLYGALTANAEDISTAYKNTNLTISETLIVIRNEFGAWLAQFNEATGLTNALSKTLLRVFNSFMSVLKKVTSNVERLANRMGGIENLLKTIGIAVGSITAALGTVKWIGAVMAGTTTIQKLGAALAGAEAGAAGATAGFAGLGASIKAIFSAFGKFGWWGLLIAAIIAALMISIEDFVGFFSGKDSVVGKFFESIGVSAEELKEKIGNVIGTLGSIFESAMEIIIKVLGLGAEAISGVLGAALLLIVEILNKLLPVVQMIIDKIMPVINKLVESLSVIIQKLAEGLMKIVNSVIDMVLPIIDLLVVVLEPLLDMIVMIIDAVLPIIDIIAPIIEMILNLVNFALQPVIAVIQVLCQLLSDILGPVLGWIKQLLEPLIKIVKSVTSVFAPLYEMLSKLLNGILKPIISVIQAVANVLSGVFSGAIKTVTKLLQPLFDILSWIMDLFADLFGWVSDGLGNITDAVGNWANDIGGKIGGAISGAADTVKGWVSSATDAIGNGLSSAWEGVKNVASTVGNGIAEGAKSVWSGVKSVGKKIGSWFGLAEGGYIGANNPTPVVIGDNKSEGEIVSPISKMRATVIDALRAFNMTGYAREKAGAVSTITNQSVNRSVTQNVHFYNTFEGSRDVQKTTSRAMKQSAGDTTRELANALAYAR